MPPPPPSDASTRVRPAPADDVLDVVLEAQRAMSTVRTDRELIDAIGPRFSAITGGTHLIGLDVRDVPPGHARVRTVLSLAADRLSVERHDWDDATPPPVGTGPIVADLVSGDHPNLAANVLADDDPTLAEWVRGRHDVLAVPIFIEGRIAEWMLVFRPAGTGFTPADVRTASSNLNLLARTAIQLKLTVEIQRLHDELQDHLDGISALQRSLLPPSLPQAPGVEMAARYRPSEFAGGDTYDVRWFGPRTLGLMIADVAGHGPPAAVVMGMIRAALTAHSALLPQRDRVPIAQEMNRVMYESLRGSTFITALFLKLDLDTGEVQYANAGHPPPRVLRARTGAAEAVAPATTMPLGVVPDLPDTSGSFVLEPGDVLALYTDGFTEAFDADRRAFDFDGLDRALGESPAGADPGTIADHVLAAVDRHVGGAHQGDDQCLVVLRRTAAPTA